MKQHLCLPCASHVTGPSRRLQQDNATEPSPSPSPAPQEAAEAPFAPLYLDEAMLDVTTLLQQATDPGAGWASSGDNGVYIGVANQAGRSYPSLSPALAAGPVMAEGGAKAAAAFRDNIVITFSGNLQGTCEGELEPIDSCIVPVATICATDPDGAIDPAAAKHSSVPDGFEAVSGAVTLKIGGEVSGTLPCVAAGCYATVQFPVMETAAASKLYQCFIVVNGQAIVSGEAVRSAASRAIDAGNTGDVPIFSCEVKQAGTYLVGKYPDPNYSEGVPESPYASLTGLVSADHTDALAVAYAFNDKDAEASLECLADWMLSSSVGALVSSAALLPCLVYGKVDGNMAMTC